MISIRRPLTQPAGRSDAFQIEIQIPENGDEGSEPALTIYRKGGAIPVADILITIDEKTKEPVVLITSNAIGDGDHNIRVNPMKAREKAVQINPRE